MEPQQQLTAALAEFAEHAAAVLAAEGSGAQILFDRLADCSRDVHDFAIRNSDRLAAEPAEYRAAFAAMRAALEQALTASKECWTAGNAAGLDDAAQDDAGQAVPREGGVDSATYVACADTGDTGDTGETGETAVGAAFESTATTESGENGDDEAEGTDAERGSSAPAVAAFEPDHTEELRTLRRLLEEEFLSRLPEIVQATLPDPPGRAADEEDARFQWRRLHLDLLLIPEDKRRRWYAEHATGPAFAHITSWEPDREPIPPMEPAEVPPIEWEELPPEPDDRTPGADSALAALTRRAHQALELFEEDDELMVARPHGTIFEDFGEAGFRDRVEEALEFLTHAVTAADPGSPDGPRIKDVATRAATLDKLIGGLVHLRLAAQGSWWWTWREQSVAELAALLEPLGCRVLGAEDLTGKDEINKHTAENAFAKARKSAQVWVLQAAIMPAATDGKALEYGRLILGTGPR